jgi:hypothetical protein
MVLQGSVKAEKNKFRIIVLSDISGLEEPDDTQSFIRFLLYSNEFDIEGIIGTGSRYGPSRGDTAYFENLIDAYGQVRDNLLLHSSGYPNRRSFKIGFKTWPTGCGWYGGSRQW